MTSLELIEGLQILQPHYIEQHGYTICCGHDVIYAYATDTPLSNEEFIRMKKLHWYQVIDSADVEDEEYSPDATWRGFV